MTLLLELETHWQARRPEAMIKAEDWKIKEWTFINHGYHPAAARAAADSDCVSDSDRARPLSLPVSAARRASDRHAGGH